MVNLSILFLSCFISWKATSVYRGYFQAICRLCFSKFCLAIFLFLRLTFYEAIVAIFWLTAGYVHCLLLRLELLFFRTIWDLCYFWNIEFFKFVLGRNRGKAAVFAIEWRDSFSGGTAAAWTDEGSWCYQGAEVAYWREAASQDRHGHHQWVQALRSPTFVVDSEERIQGQCF